MFYLNIIILYIIYNRLYVATGYKKDTGNGISCGKKIPGESLLVNR